MSDEGSDTSLSGEGSPNHPIEEATTPLHSVSSVQSPHGSIDDMLSPVGSSQEPFAALHVSASLMSIETPPAVPTAQAGNVSLTPSASEQQMFQQAVDWTLSSHNMDELLARNPFDDISEDDIKKLDAVLRSDELSALLTQTTPLRFEKPVLLTGADESKSSPQQSDMERTIQESICSLLREATSMDDEQATSDVDEQATAHDLVKTSSDEAHDDSHEFDIDMATVRDATMILRQGLEHGALADIAATFEDSTTSPTTCDETGRRRRRDSLRHGDNGDDDDDGDLLEVTVTKQTIGGASCDGDDLRSPSLESGDDRSGDESSVGGRRRKGAHHPTRRSVRISDQEQRDMAEKIRQENLRLEQEAMDALRQLSENEDGSTPSGSAHGSTGKGESRPKYSKGKPSLGKAIGKGKGKGSAGPTTSASQDGNHATPRGRGTKRISDLDDGRRRKTDDDDRSDENASEKVSNPGRKHQSSEGENSDASCPIERSTAPEQAPCSVSGAEDADYESLKSNKDETSPMSVDESSASSMVETADSESDRTPSRRDNIRPNERAPARSLLLELSQKITEKVKNVENSKHSGAAIAAKAFDAGGNASRSRPDTLPSIPKLTPDTTNVPSPVTPDRTSSSSASFVSDKKDDGPEKLIWKPGGIGVYEAFKSKKIADFEVTRKNSSQEHLKDDRSKKGVKKKKEVDVVSPQRITNEMKIPKSNIGDHSIIKSGHSSSEAFPREMIVNVDRKVNEVDLRSKFNLKPLTVVLNRLEISDLKLSKSVIEQLNFKNVASVCEKLETSDNSVSARSRLGKKTENVSKRRSDHKHSRSESSERLGSAARDKERRRHGDGRQKGDGRHDRPRHSEVKDGRDIKRDEKRKDRSVEVKPANPDDRRYKSDEKGQTPPADKEEDVSTSRVSLMDGADEDEDPDKIWCICRKPHQNKFMICCDQCEEWYHGDCVAIDKERGQAMERDDEEWICPVCLKKELTQDRAAGETYGAIDAKSIGRDTARVEETIVTSAKTPPIRSNEPSPSGEFRRARVETDSVKKKRKLKFFKDEKSLSNSQLLSTCIFTKCTEPPRPASIYCSGLCILRHAHESLVLLAKEKEKQFGKGKVELNSGERIVVMERLTGKILTGPNAPTAGNLRAWLERHSTFEVLRPKPPQQQQQYQYPSQTAATSGAVGHTSNQRPNVATSSRNADSRSTGAAGAAGAADSAQQEETGADDSATDTVRINVRKILRELLEKRATEACDNDELRKADIKSLVTEIEDEMFKYHEGTSMKYKGKFRSLVFTIRDPNNQGLFRRVLLGKIAPRRLARMSGEELASREVSEWKVSGQQQTTAPRSVETAQKFIIPKKPPGEKIDPRADLLSSLIPTDTTAQHRMHLFDQNCRICQTKQRAAKKKELQQSRQEKREKHENNRQKKNLTKTAPDSSAGIEDGSVASNPKRRADFWSRFQQDRPRPNDDTSLFSGDEPQPATVEPNPLQIPVSTCTPSDNDRRTPQERRDVSRDSNDKRKEYNPDSSFQSGANSRGRDLGGAATSMPGGVIDRGSFGSSTDPGYLWDGRVSQDTRGLWGRPNEDGDSMAGGGVRKSVDRRAPSEVSSESSFYPNDGMEIEDDDDGDDVTASAAQRPNDAGAENIPELVLASSSDVTTTTTISAEKRPPRSPSVVSPDSAFQSGLEKPNAPQTNKPLWKGFITMLDIPKFFTSAYSVSGPSDYLWKDLPDTIHLCGRIPPDHVFDYLSKIKSLNTKEMIILRFLPGGDDEKEAYMAMYSYLNSRNRCGVVGNNTKLVKDMYIIPLASHSPVPPILLPFVGPGLEPQRSHLLLGVMVRQASERPPDARKDEPVRDHGKSSKRKKSHRKKAKKEKRESGWSDLKKRLRDQSDGIMNSESSTIDSAQSSTVGSPSSQVHEEAYSPSQELEQYYVPELGKKKSPEKIGDDATAADAEENDDDEEEDEVVEPDPDNLLKLLSNALKGDEEKSDDVAKNDDFSEHALENSDESWPECHDIAKTEIQTENKEVVLSESERKRLQFKERVSKMMAKLADTPDDVAVPSEASTKSEPLLSASTSAITLEAPGLGSGAVYEEVSASLPPPIYSPQFIQTPTTSVSALSPFTAEVQPHLPTLVAPLPVAAQLHPTSSPSVWTPVPCLPPPPPPETPPLPVQPPLPCYTHLPLTPLPVAAPQTLEPPMSCYPSHMSQSYRVPFRPPPPPPGPPPMHALRHLQFAPPPPPPPEEPVVGSGLPGISEYSSDGEEEEASSGSIIQGLDDRLAAFRHQLPAIIAAAPPPPPIAPDGDNGFNVHVPHSNAAPFERAHQIVPGVQAQSQTEGVQQCVTSSYTDPLPSYSLNVSHFGGYATSGTDRRDYMSAYHCQNAPDSYGQFTQCEDDNQQDEYAHYDTEDAHALDENTYHHIEDEEDEHHDAHGEVAFGHDDDGMIGDRYISDLLDEVARSEDPYAMASEIMVGLSETCNLSHHQNFIKELSNKVKERTEELAHSELLNSLQDVEESNEEDLCQVPNDGAMRTNASNFGNFPGAVSSGSNRSNSGSTEHPSESYQYRRPSLLGQGPAQSHPHRDQSLSRLEDRLPTSANRFDTLFQKSFVGVQLASKCNDNRFTKQLVDDESSPSSKRWDDGGEVPVNVQERKIEPCLQRIPQKRKQNPVEKPVSSDDSSSDDNTSMNFNIRRTMILHDGCKVPSKKSKKETILEADSSSVVSSTVVPSIVTTVSTTADSTTVATGDDIATPAVENVVTDTKPQETSASFDGQGLSTPTSYGSAVEAKKPGVSGVDVVEVENGQLESRASVSLEVDNSNDVPMLMDNIKEVPMQLDDSPLQPSEDGFNDDATVPDDIVVNDGMYVDHSAYEHGFMSNQMGGDMNSDDSFLHGANNFAIGVNRNLPKLHFNTGVANDFDQDLVNNFQSSFGQGKESQLVHDALPYSRQSFEGSNFGTDTDRISEFGHASSFVAGSDSARINTSCSSNENPMRTRDSSEMCGLTKEQIVDRDLMREQLSSLLRARLANLSKEGSITPPVVGPRQIEELKQALGEYDNLQRGLQHSTNDLDPRSVELRELERREMELRDLERRSDEQRRNDELRELENREITLRQRDRERFMRRQSEHDGPSARGNLDRASFVDRVAMETRFNGSAGDFRGPEFQSHSEPGPMSDFRSNGQRNRRPDVRGSGLADNFSSGPGPKDNVRRNVPRNDFRGPGPMNEFGGPGHRENFRGQGPRDDYRGPSQRDDYRGPGSRDDFRGSHSRDEMRGPGFREDYRGPGQRENPGGPGPRDDFRRSGHRDDFAKPSFRDDFNAHQGPRDDFSGPCLRDDFRGHGPRGDFRGSGSRDDFRGPGHRDEFSGPGPRDNFRRSGNAPRGSDSRDNYDRYGRAADDIRGRGDGGSRGHRW